MGTISISVDGEAIFNWKGDEAAIAEVMDKFPRAPKAADITPDSFAQSCLHRLSSGMLRKQVAVCQEMQMMAVIWLILGQNTNNDEHPGKIRDYAGMTDFDVDLRRHDRGFNAHISATSKFKS